MLHYRTHISEKQYRKDVRKYEFFRRLLGGALCRAFGLEPKPVALPDDRPYLVIANHTTGADIFLMGLSFPHMYFVASAHILSWGALSSFIYWALHPIARLKGSTDALTVLEIRRRLKLGANVCIFPEGARSPSGVTEKLHPTTVKLIRSCRCGLVTCRIKGGFFTQPIFAPGFRRGRMNGEVVHTLSKADIAAMSDAELEGTIESDLYEDACETQSLRGVRFRCKKPGLYMERALFLCPKCGEVGRLRSDGGGVSCGCGFRAGFDEYGKLSGTALDYSGWYKYQRTILRQLCISGFEFRDGTLDFREITSESRFRRKKLPYTALTLNTGRLTLDGAGTAAPAETVELGSIAGMTCYGSNHLVISFRGRNIIVSGGKRFNAMKYTEAYKILMKGTTGQVPLPDSATDRETNV